MKRYEIELSGADKLCVSFEATIFQEKTAEALGDAVEQIFSSHTVVLILSLSTKALLGIDEEYISPTGETIPVRRLKVPNQSPSAGEELQKRVRDPTTCSH